MRDIDALFAEVERNRDAATIAVLADALVERGDPRGELIHVQRALQGAGDAERAELAAREQALLGQLRVAILGDLADTQEIAFGYVDGFLDRVSATGPQAHLLGQALARVLASPHARLLRTVAIDPTEQENLDRPIANVLDRLTTVPKPQTLRRLEIGAALARSAGYRVFRDDGEVTFSDDLSKVLEAFPEIDDLRIDLGAVAITWPELRSTTLRRFALVVPRLFDQDIEALAAAELPALESFELWTGASILVNDEYELYAPFDDELGDEGYEDEAEQDEAEDRFDPHEAADVEQLEPVFAMLDNTQITSLAIANFAYAVGPLVEAIAQHPFAQQLERLDLSRANRLRTLPEAMTSVKLPRLRELVIGDAVVSRDAFATLPELVAKLSDPLQRDPEMFRYVVTME